MKSRLIIFAVLLISVICLLFFKSEKTDIYLQFTNNPVKKTDWAIVVHGGAYSTVQITEHYLASLDMDKTWEINKGLL